MKTLMILLFPALMLAQRAMFQPVSLKVSNSALGSGRDVGVWVVTVAMPTGAKAVKREDILMCAPSIKALPNWTANGLLIRKADKDTKTVFADLGEAGLKLSGPITSAVGAMKDSPNLVYVGAGISIIELVVRLIRKQAPQPELFGADKLLPDSIDRSGQWFVISSLGPNAQPIGPVQIPLSQ